MLGNTVKNAARRAVTELSQLPKPGEKLHGFTLLRTKHVPELELTALHLRHDKTGAEHLHISRDDSNNVFSIGFKTNPPDDTGVPHILEHTTLCGSEKYPIRDPFFKMLPRTLSNFMNAFTASDHTFYPFATTNAQDFKNLLSVYLDATLRPLLKESDFTQEGWRIGPENPQALIGNEGKAKPEDEKLVFKGVVYNEMKGQMSDAGYLFYIRFQDHIFPDINNSGGDPQKITDLTYEQLRNFHAEHYHPSNAKVFTYGDMPLADHLVEIDAQLGAFGKIKGDLEIRRPVDLSDGPREVTLFGPVDPLVDPAKQFKTSLSWVLGDTTDVVESFSLALISALLMDGYGSPLYKGLIDTGLGTDWSPNTGYDSSARIGIFSVGLTGVQEADVPKLKAEVQNILRNVRAKGFERSKIDGYLHQLELGLKHKTANFGTSLLQRLKPKWFTGVDPFDSLAWNDTIAAFEAELAKGDYLEGLLEKYLLNDNTLTFTMAPSETYSQELAKEEETRLSSKLSEATAKAGGEAEAKKNFEERELLLLAEQAKSNTEDLGCLPSVHVQDIPRQKEPVVVRDELSGTVNTQWREAPTNGLTYFRAINTLDNLPDELRVLIPLFTDAVMRLGTKDMTMEQLEDLIKLKTGGVSVGYHSASLPTDFTRATEGLIFTGMALDRNVPVMFDLLRKLIVETNFESPEAVQQIRQLLQASADGVVNDIASSGHAFARRSAEAGLTWDAWLKEQVSGLTQVKLVTSLASRPESDQLDDVISKLKLIQQLALAGNVRTAITCDSGSVQDNSSSLSKFLGSVPTTPVSFPKRQAPEFARNVKSFYPLPYQVYYGALAVPTAPYTSADGAPLQILSQLLTHKHLHHEIREKGGAYGGGAYSRPLDGIFGFYSYRDPNPLNTMNIMRNAGRWAVDKKWTDRDLEEAKISVFQGVDAPRSVNEEGMGRFLYGVTEEMKQKRREQLLDVTKDQVREVAQKYVVDALAKESERLVFLGEKRAWVNDDWKVNEMDINGVE
ncbi:Metalloenzyme, LuxS/M16 peptidase-like protein [Phialemonium atrogriseum]|uniref:Presequence protease, mitochondrial n=1 Tax=Phialemonium atrogriseum TaxID=1093897 RepID=A0AAJ0FRV8_9PEZI|nr:Metalloenzyme, LuxS/M16 peptidase-like protein [Phialemonium atrogriseum]KAK1770550.1 Metalloenzyme, LuxS/M16 peptidase-like protein [Phialemonium atrogriseum]